MRTAFLVTLIRSMLWYCQMFRSVGRSLCLGIALMYTNRQW